jgi:hypothetical protein
MYAVRERQLALRLLDQGLTLSEVSRELGISRAAIRDWRDHGVGQETVHACPPSLLDASYAALFGYYLGDGCISRTGRTFSLRVSCDRTWPGIIADVEACLRAVHPARPVYQVRAPGAIVVQN